MSKNVFAAMLIVGVSILTYQPVSAQSVPTNSNVLSGGCATASYTGGQNRPDTQTTTGLRCTSASVSGGTITTITNPVGVKGSDGSTIASGTNPLPAALATTTASGTITTQNLVSGGAATAGSAVAIAVTMNGTCSEQITGTYTAAGGFSAQVTVDGTNWVTLSAPATFLRSNGSQSSTIPSAADDIFQSEVNGHVQFRITALGAVTGTATVTINCAQGTSQIIGAGGSFTAAQSTAANLNATVVGTGTFGVQNTSPLVPQTRANYRIISTGYTAYATPTDLFCLTGSGTKTVYVSIFNITANATAATLGTISFIKRTTSNTGGTASNPTITLLDSAEAAATATPNLYSVIPSGLGTSAGLLGYQTASIAATTAAPTNFAMASIAPSPSITSMGLPITLRGTGEQVCANFGGAALPSGFTSTIYVEWQE